MADFIYYNVKDPAIPVEKFWYWKLDGKVIEAKTKRDSDECDKLGFRRLTESEMDRFKPGSYNPVYDLRGKSGQVIPLIDYPPQPQGDVLTVIKI